MEKGMRMKVDKLVYDIGHKSTYYIMRAIIDGTRGRVKDTQFIKAVVSQKKNKDTVLNIPVSCIAIASLHILEIEEYTGEDELVKNLIESKFDF